MNNQTMKKKEQKDYKKLVDLLNQFEIETNNDPMTRQERDENRMQCFESEILSKKYLFIERLCETDKIDVERLSADDSMFVELLKKYTLENVILMLLSISFRPLDLLYSFLR